jgi:hypothetical protein
VGKNYKAVYGFLFLVDGSLSTIGFRCLQLRRKTLNAKSAKRSKGIPDQSFAALLCGLRALCGISK